MGLSFSFFRHKQNITIQFRCIIGANNVQFLSLVQMIFGLSSFWRSSVILIV